MKIRIANNQDYINLALMKWDHCAEDDIDYDEHNLVGVNKDEFISEFTAFLSKQNEYQIFVAEDNGEPVSAMFVHMISKLPKPNGNAKYIAYLTNVYTNKTHRNQKIGTKLLNYTKQYLTERQCELIFAWPSDNSVNWYKRNGFIEENKIFECPLCEE